MCLAQVEPFAFKFFFIRMWKAGLNGKLAVNYSVFHFSPVIGKSWRWKTFKIAFGNQCQNYYMDTNKIIVSSEV